jgi:acylglycerol lipase
MNCLPKAAQRLAVLLLTGLVSACRLPEGPPPTPVVHVAPHLTPESFVADDAAALPLRSWLPDGEPKAVILALHGFNDYSHSFDAPATEWARRGIATYAYDQRGFGEAPDHGLWAGTPRLSLDAVEATDLLRKKYPGVPLYVLGESMGGAVVITAASEVEGTPPLHADGIILAAPAIWGRTTMNIFERAALWIADGTVPNMTLTGQGLGVLPSDNIAMLRALGRDPLVIKGTRVETIKGLVDLMDDALAAGPHLHTALLLLYGAHDQLIPDAPMRRFIASLPPETPQRIAFYPDGYHMLLRDLEGPTVDRDVATWVTNPEAPLPSGADQRGVAALAEAR